MSLLSLRAVTLGFGGPSLLNKADFSVEQGERVCILGRNGEGKSSLLKLIMGENLPDSGEVTRQQKLWMPKTAGRYNIVWIKFSAVWN